MDIGTTKKIKTGTWVHIFDITRTLVLLLQFVMIGFVIFYEDAFIIKFILMNVYLLRFAYHLH